MCGTVKKFLEWNFPNMERSICFIAAKSTPQNFLYIFCPISPDDKVTGQVCYYATEQCSLNIINDFNAMKGKEESNLKKK